MTSMASTHLHHRQAGVAEREAAQRDHRLNRERVYQGVQRFPNLTAAELAQHVGLDHHETQRRLSDLANAGLVVKNDEARRVCTVKGRRMCIWHLPEGQGRLI